MSLQTINPLGTVAGTPSVRSSVLHSGSTSVRTLRQQRISANGQSAAAAAAVTTTFGSIPQMTAQAQPQQSQPSLHSTSTIAIPSSTTITNEYQAFPISSNQSEFLLKKPSLTHSTSLVSSTTKHAQQPLLYQQQKQLIPPPPPSTHMQTQLNSPQLQVPPKIPLTSADVFPTQTVQSMSLFSASSRKNKGIASALSVSAKSMQIQSLSQASAVQSASITSTNAAMQQQQNSGETTKINTFFFPSAKKSQITNKISKRTLHFPIEIQQQQQQIQQEQQQQQQEQQQQQQQQQLKQIKKQINHSNDRLNRGNEQSWINQDVSEGMSKRDISPNEELLQKQQQFQATTKIGGMLLGCKNSVESVFNNKKAKQICDIAITQSQSPIIRSPQRKHQLLEVPPAQFTDSAKLLAEIRRLQMINTTYQERIDVLEKINRDQSSTIKEKDLQLQMQINPAQLSSTQQQSSSIHIRPLSQRGGGDYCNSTTNSNGGSQNQLNLLSGVTSPMKRCEDASILRQSQSSQKKKHPKYDVIVKDDRAQQNSISSTSLGGMTKSSFLQQQQNEQRTTTPSAAMLLSSDYQCQSVSEIPNHLQYQYQLQQHSPIIKNRMKILSMDLSEAEPQSMQQSQFNLNFNLNNEQEDAQSIANSDDAVVESVEGTQSGKKAKISFKGFEKNKSYSNCSNAQTTRTKIMQVQMQTIVERMKKILSDRRKQIQLNR